MARETRALPGGYGPDGPVVEIRAQRPARPGRDGVLSSIPLHPVGTVSHRPSPGLPGEAGMARETRALPGRATARMGRWSKFGQEARWFR